MEYTEKQLAEFKLEFKRRSKIRIRGAVAMLGVFLLFSSLKTMMPLLPQGLVVLLTIGFLGYLAYNWRCPACTAPLNTEVTGGRWGVKHYVCPKCGVALM
jgi:hypothetical protein